MNNNIDNKDKVEQESTKDNTRSSNDGNKPIEPVIEPKTKKNARTKKQNKGSWGFDLFVIILLFAGIIAVTGLLSGTKDSETVTYKELVEILDKEAAKKEPREISLVEHSTGKLDIYFIKGSDPTEKGYKETIYSTSTSPKSNEISKLLADYEVNYVYKSKISFFDIFFYIILFLILATFVLPMFRKGQVGGLSVGSSIGKKVDTDKSKISFDEIGGLTDEIIKEINQTQELINNPNLAKKLGLKPSKGIILEGPSGTGKTIIARAISSSYDATFFSASGSEFVELFSGLGAKKVRDLFEKAQKNAPSVIFIDEIDAVAKKRSNTGINSNDEREQTLNQLLVCMDGLVENSDILVIAATNRIDMLDSALLRPGRFDYKIKIDLPDIKGRIEIMNIHLKGRPISTEMQNNIDSFAKSLIGFSGADIEQIVNMASYKAFNDRREEITKDDFDYALDRIIIGNKTRALTSEEMKKRIAYHEAGHALLSSILNPGHIRKVTIIPRGGAGGYLAEIPKEGLLTDEDLRNEIKIKLAGGVAEKIAFGNHSYGVDNDIETAKSLIIKMIERWGMGSKNLIPTFSEDDKFSESEKLYSECLDETFSIINNNKEAFDKITSELLDKETLDGEQIEEIMTKCKKPN